ncbi:MAG: Tn3 family transposase [Bacteroidota bacterium]
MPKISIWSDQEIKAYDHPPIFDSYQRKQFFRLPSALKKHLDALPSTVNKIGFYLMVGYFKAQKRFFVPSKFHPRDVEFIANRLGILLFDKPLSSYKEQTYNRHKKIILAHFGYTAFSIRHHRSLINTLIEKPLWSFSRIPLMLDMMLEELHHRHIELPSYHTLQTILTIAIRKRNREIHQKLERLLLPEHKVALDSLIVKINDQYHQSPYVFTDLKKLIRKDNPKSIRINLAKHRTIWEVYEQIQVLLSQLNLNESAIRYFGELVIKYKSHQVIRRASASKYLLLLGFTAFQIRQFEDQLVDTFISACRSSFSAVEKEHKEYLFANRLEYRQRLKQALDIAQNKNELLKTIQQITWNTLPATDKVAQIQVLLPLNTDIEKDKEALELLRQQYKKQGQDARFHYLEDQSVALQQRVSSILKSLHFNPKTSSKKLIDAIDYFVKKDGAIAKNAPTDFLKEENKSVLSDENGRFRVSLYKILLFEAVYFGIKSGQLNLQYSYRYKAYDEYLVEEDNWKENQEALLNKAELIHLKQCSSVLDIVRPRLDEHFTQTNEAVLGGENEYFTINKNGKYHVKTPKVEKEKIKETGAIFPNEKIIPISEILATINQLTSYLNTFEHYQSYYRRQRPDDNVFLAGIMAYGCNLGVETMAKVARSVTAAQLENTANWYFDLENIQKATDKINNFMNDLELANLFRKQKGKLRTSSDGQKINMASEQTIDATFAYKHAGKRKGITAYSFIDERFIPFYATIIHTAEREGTYVIDGLFHNEAIRSTSHSTDTHGYTEAVFGLMDLFGFGFAPRIAKLYKQHLYAFEKIETYRNKGYSILPDGYINTELIEENWDAILRLLVSIKLKYCTASQIFKRLNSYSRQHPVYRAVKEYGKIIKTIYVLRYINSVKLRQAIQQQLNIVELSNRFSSAITVANAGEMIFLNHRDQLIADACKNLIKSAVTCWNYLYMTRHIQKLKTEKQKKEFIHALKQGTLIAWRHIYFNGVYDFSKEKLTDSFDLLFSQNYDLFNG